MTSQPTTQELVFRAFSQYPCSVCGAPSSRFRQQRYLCREHAHDAGDRVPDSKKGGRTAKNRVRECCPRGRPKD